MTVLEYHIKNIIIKKNNQGRAGGQISWGGSSSSVALVGTHKELRSLKSYPTNRRLRLGLESTNG